MCHEFKHRVFYIFGLFQIIKFAIEASKADDNHFIPLLLVCAVLIEQVIINFLSFYIHTNAMQKCAISRKNPTTVRKTDPGRPRSVDTIRVGCYETSSRFGPVFVWETQRSIMVWWARPYNTATHYSGKKKQHKSVKKGDLILTSKISHIYKQTQYF